MKNYTDYREAEDLKRMNFIVSNIMENIDRNSKIIDIGCGNGNMSIQLGKFGYSVTGIDIDPDSIEFAKKMNDMDNVKFFVKNVMKFRDEKQIYDVVICSEVLEHLTDPARMIGTIRQILKDKGILIVTVPNGRGPREILATKPQRWLRENAGFIWNFINYFKKLIGFKGDTNQSKSENLEHIHFFTRKKLKKLADEYSFTIVKWGKANFIEKVFPFSILTRKISALKIFDNKFADLLPYVMVSGFFSVWVKK